MYVMLYIRLDIAFIVSAVLRYAANPITTYEAAIKGILRYLKGIVGLSLVFKGDLIPL